MIQPEDKLRYDSLSFRKKEAPEAVLGALYTPEDTWFRVWVPNAEKVAVKLYSCGTEEESTHRGGYLRKISMEPSKRTEDGSVWEADVRGDLHGTYYTYEVTRKGVRKECVDIYAKACGANGKRGMIVDLARTDPEGWEKDKEWVQENKNTVIYELHVKDFSYHMESGISKEHRGRYLAFTDKTGKERGLRYLKHLGISHIHLLPVFDFASVDETGHRDQFNWGYDPQNYNIPEGSYSTDPFHGEVRIREFKQMVQEIHKAGIGVIMDVVYNHTYSSDGNFQILAPNYYYRTDKDGNLSNGSACGNETASERVMFGKFMIESLLYWAEEYHIDGFRFDLMGLHDVKTLNDAKLALKKKLPEKNILLYGEPWIAAKSSMARGFLPAVKENIHKLEGIAIFSDDTRDAIKGSVFKERAPGFVNGAKGKEKEIASAYMAWCDGGHDFAPVDPGQIISYVSVHDNFTLWDKLVLTERSKDFLTKNEKILDMNKLCAGIIFTCLGTPLFQAGEEFGRTKYGDENSYQSSPSINCLDWKRKDEFSELVEYYRGLIALRGQIPLYQNQSAQDVKAVQILHADNGYVAIRMDLTSYQARWQSIYIVANASGKRVTVSVPKGSYQKLADKKNAWLWKKPFRKIFSKETEQLSVAGGSIGIFGSN